MEKSQEIVTSSFSGFIMDFVFVNHSLIASDTVNHFPRKNVIKSKRKGEQFALSYTIRRITYEQTLVCRWIFSTWKDFCWAMEKKNDLSVEVTILERSVFVNL